MRSWPRISSRRLFLISILYLYLPLAIFLCCWVRSWYGIPAALGLGIAIIAASRDIPVRTLRLPSGKYLVALILLVLWVVLSGIGGFIWQNEYDHMFRNAVFLDLVSHPWPVTEGESVLTYYIGYWLPAAAVAKTTGNLTLGWLMQLIYGIIGILLAFRLCIEKIGSFRLRYILPFILFSGVDIIAFFLAGAQPRWDYHIELWSDLAAWESNSTLLFWVYNQAVPAWVATMLILNFGKGKGRAALILSCLAISAPFPTVGLFPLTVYYLLCGIWNTAGTKGKLIAIFSPGNVMAVLAVIPVACYMKLNTQTILQVGLWDLSPSDWTWQFCLLLSAEILVFIPFIFRQISHSAEFYVLLLTSAIGLLLMVGSSIDFNSRIELPLDYFMTLQLMIYLARWDKLSRLTKGLFLLVGAAAAVTPSIEIARSLYRSIRVPSAQYRYFKMQSIFEDHECRRNFVADSVLRDPEKQSLLLLLNYPPAETPSTPAEGK